MNTVDIVKLVANIGSLGIICWLVWHTFTHTIPRLADSFNAALGDQREDFKEALVTQRDFFAQQMERERQVEDGQTSKIVDAIKDLKEEFRRG